MPEFINGHEIGQKEVRIMSTARLNVFITELGEPCTISNGRWVVAVSHCNGTLLNWSEGRYRQHSGDAWTNIAQHIPPHSADTPPLPRGWYYDNVPAPNGHVEMEVPPGSYVVIGSLHTWFSHGVLYGNWYTDHAIVQASGGQDVCVTLYAPSVMSCFKRLIDFVIPLGEKYRIFKHEEAQQAAKAMRAVVGSLSMSPFEQEEQKVLMIALEGMAGEGEGKSPKKR